MTISTQTRTAGPFIGTGLVVTYPFAFKVFQASDLSATRTDTSLVQTTLTLSVDYTAALNPDQNAAPGGSLTLTTALPTGYQLLLTSAVPLTQAASLTNAGGFFPKIIEDALDRLTILMQQLGFFGSQTLRTPEATGVPVLPAASVRASNLLGFDSLGNPVAVAPVSGSAAALATDLTNSVLAAKGAGQVGFGFGLGYAVGTIGKWLNDLATSAGSTFIGFLQLGAGAILRTLQAKLRETYSVADFGAVGDGVTDDTSNIQAAINYCAANGKRLEFKPTAIYAVSALSTTYNSLTRSFHIDMCGSTLLCNGASANPLISLLNTKNVNISNGTLDGNFSLVQSILCKIWANDGASGSSYNVLHNVRLRNAQYGVQLGDPARANEPYVSENTLVACNAIGVLNPAIVYGVQGELNILGGEMTAGTNGWVSPPGGYVVNALTAVGGNIRMTGGEITSYVNQGVSIRPIVSASGNLYGKVFCVGTWCECQNRLAVAENPGAVATPVGGVISFIGCSGGIVLNNTLAAIDAAADYAGDIEVNECYFWSSTARSQSNISAPAAASIRVDSKSFNPWVGTVPALGAGFVAGIAGFTGGKVFYDNVVQLTALLVQQNAAQSLPNGAWTKLQLQNKIFDTNSNFDAAVNYRFTPSAPGYYQINGQVQIASSTSPPGVDIYKNGVSTGYAIGGNLSGVFNGTASISRLLFLNGTTDYVELYGIQSSGGALNTVGAVTQLSLSYARAA